MDIFHAACGQNEAVKNSVDSKPEQKVDFEPDPQPPSLFVLLIF
jgi:hypothetical protein